MRLGICREALKSLDPGFCGRYMDAPDYPEAARAALQEMARQVGPLSCGRDGLARQGLLVRHLVMPGRAEDSRQIIDLVAGACPGAAINVMEQYRPCGEAGRFAELNQYPDHEDVMELQQYAVERGLRELSSASPKG